MVAEWYDASADCVCEDVRMRVECNCILGKGAGSEAGWNCRDRDWEEERRPGGSGAQGEIGIGTRVGSEYGNGR